MVSPRHPRTASCAPANACPPASNLAAELKISRIPVSSAYEQLLAEGYFETFVGAGTCVARSIPDDALKPAPGKISGAAGGRASATESAGARKISRRAMRLRTPPGSPGSNELGAFRVSLPALEHFPVGLWSKLVNRHVRRRQPRQLHGLRRRHGLPPFREAIAEYLGAVRAVRCEPRKFW